VNEVRQKGRASEVRGETRWERHLEWRAAEQAEVIATARRGRLYASGNGTQITTLKK